MNKVILIGNIGNIESRKTNTGKKVTVFSLATNKIYKDTEGNKQKTTQWHRIEYWDMSDGLESCLSKGKQVAIEGELRYEDYEKDGVTRIITKIVCNSLELLGGSNADISSTQTHHTSSIKMKNNVFDDDIPF
jgi:single-strand DNA-binding protein